MHNLNLSKDIEIVATKNKAYEAKIGQIHDNLKKKKRMTSKKYHVISKN